MPHIIRDAEFHTRDGEGLWPGMWVHTIGWQHPRWEPGPLDACYLWQVEQHDGVMLLAGRGADVLLPLTLEIAEDCVLFKPAIGISLADYPDEWAAIRKLGWGVYLTDRAPYGQWQTALVLDCQRGYREEWFWLPHDLYFDALKNPDIVRSFLKTSWWRLKHPKYAQALATQQPAEFWNWPHTPEPKQLHEMGVAAFKTVEGRIEIGPDGTLKATGRKRWGFPTEGEPE